jgi:GNAT superfamily N-acetyltransferase
MSATVRPADEQDLPAVMTVFDAGLLEAAVDAVRAGIERGTLLVATTDAGQVVGACLLEGDEIAAIAVSPKRRGQGIGRALVGAAAASRERLVAEFDPRVEPFWASLGFEIEPIEARQPGTADPDRYRGRLDPA